MPKLEPAATVAQVYDDALAERGAAPERAIFTQVSPRLAIGYGLERLTVLGHAALDAEFADAAPTQRQPWLRWNADLSVIALATERLTLTAGGQYWNTNTPRDLNAVAGYDPGAGHAVSASALAGAGYSFTSLVRGSLDCSFTSTSAADVVTDEVFARGSLRQQLSAISSGRLELVVRHLGFRGQGTEDVVAPLAGWENRFSSALSFSVLAGPRFNGLSLQGLEGTAALGWESAHLSSSIAVASTQTAIAGQVGLVDSWSASWLWALRPDERWRLSAAPAFTALSGAPMNAQVFEVRLDAARSVNDWMALMASYRLSVQHVDLARPGPAAGTTGHNLFLVGVTFSAPQAAARPANPIAIPAWPAPEPLARP